MAYAHQGIDLKPLPGRPAPAVAHAEPSTPVAEAGAPQRPATLSARSAETLSGIEAAMKSAEKRREDTGLASSSIDRAAKPRENGVVTGKGAAGGG
jgi:penicillin-binding protein 1A